jgi:hypothetical protein
LTEEGIYLFFTFVQRTPSEDKHISRRPSGPDAIGKSGEMSESELEKQRALLLAQLKEPESE